jgi:hypothetical protein
MVAFDNTVNLGHIISFVGFVVGGLGVVWTMRHDIVGIKTEMTSMQAELSKITDVLVASARQDEKLTAQDKRMNRIDEEIADLRRGHGFINKGKS